MTSEPWLVAAVTAGALGYVLRENVSELVWTWRARNWPRVQGTIIEGSLHADTRDKNGFLEWYVRMRYNFHAEDSHYGNEFKVDVKNEQEGESYISTHKGQAVTVRYKPGNPDICHATAP
jgi:hypothetical protein